MTRPSPGLLAFHNGHPVEFLHVVRDTDGGAVWLVRPLFIANPVNRTELFRAGDRLTPLHTKHW
jgi:hypothetical protein